MKKKIFTILSLVAFLGLSTALASCGDKAVESVTINQEAQTLTVGDTFDFTATVNPSDATNKNITWSSSDVEVGTIGEDGKFAALKAGNTTVTVTTVSGNKTDSRQVTVNPKAPDPVPVTSVSINQGASVEVTEGSNFQFTAKVLPDNADVKTVTWSVSDASIGTISEGGNFHAIKVGNVTVTCTSDADASKKATCAVTVKAKAPDPKHVESVTVSGPSEANINEEKTFVATVLPDNADNKNVTWSVNKEGATINDNGVFKATVVGAYVVRATAVDNGKYGEATINVVDPTPVPVPVTGVEITGFAPTSPKVNEEVTFTAKVSPNNASDKLINWSISEKSGATISNDGVFKATVAGTYHVIATSHYDAKFSDTKEITVTDPTPVPVPVTGISITPSTDQTITVGETLDFTAKVSPEGADDPLVIFSSSNVNVATINDKGELITLNAGETTVRATSHENSSIYAECKVTVEDVPVTKADYYLVGYINGSAEWSEDLIASRAFYKEQEGIYSLTIDLLEGDGVKAMSSGDDKTYIPDGIDNEIEIETTGNYTFTLTIGESNTLTYEINPEVDRKTVSFKFHDPDQIIEGSSMFVYGFKVGYSEEIEFPGVMATLSDDIYSEEISVSYDHVVISMIKDQTVYKTGDLAYKDGVYELVVDGTSLKEYAMETYYNVCLDDVAHKLERNQEQKEFEEHMILGLDTEDGNKLTLQTVSKDGTVDWNVKAENVELQDGYTGVIVEADKDGKAIITMPESTFDIYLKLNEGNDVLTIIDENYHPTPEVNYYLVGNRSFVEGKEGPSWDDVSKGFKLTLNSSTGEYEGTVELAADDIVKVRSNEETNPWREFVTEPVIDQGVTYHNAFSHGDMSLGENGNGVVAKAGEYDIYLRIDGSVWVSPLPEAPDPTPSETKNLVTASFHDEAQIPADKTLFAYYWNPEQSYQGQPTWPGVEMSYDEVTKTFSIEISESFTKLIFAINDGEGGYIQSDENGFVIIEETNSFDLVVADKAIKEYQPGPAVANYYVVGNRSFVEGKEGESWTDLSLALKLTTNPENEKELMGTVELFKDNEFRIRSDETEITWGVFDTGEGSAFAAGDLIISGDNAKVVNPGVYTIIYKLDSNSVWISPLPEPEFHWGVAGSINNWTIGEGYYLEETDIPADAGEDAEYAYKGIFTFETNSIFKVTNTIGEWVNNSDSCGFNPNKSTPNAFTVTGDDDHNIKCLTAGEYEVLLIIYEGAVKEGNNFVSGMSIRINEVEVPPAPTTEYGLEIDNKFEKLGTDGNASYTVDKTLNIGSVIKVAKVDDQGNYSYLDVYKITYDESKFTFDSMHSALTVIHAGKFTFVINLDNGEVDTMVAKVYEEPVVLEGYYVSVNGTPTYSLYKNKSVENEYLCDVAHFIANDKLTIYDATNDKTFHAKLDQYSLPHFTDGKDAITCDRDGYYSLCLKLIPDNDELYIGEPKVEYTGFYASTQEHRYELVPATADADHKANYSVSLAENPLTAGTRVNFYGEFMYEGDEVSNLIDYKIAPNPDDTGNKIQNNLKPATKGGVDFTVLKNTDGTLYFNINNDDSFGFWLTGGPEILEGYWLQVNGQNVAKLNYDKKEGDFDQYKTTYQTNVGDVITFYDADNDKNISVTLDAASTGFSQSKGITCTTAGNYDFYLKLKYGQDQVYIGPHIEQNAIDVKFTLPDWEGTLDGLKVHYWGNGISDGDAIATMNGKEGTSHIEVPKSLTTLNMCVCFKQNGVEKWSTNVSVTPEDLATYKITSTWEWVDDHFKISIAKI